jgi:TP901 family phage tail tape measure protein
MNRDLSLALRVFADTNRLDSGLRRGEGSVHRFANTARHEFANIRSAFDSLGGKLAAVGFGIGLGETLRDSARLDKSLTQIGQTAGESKARMGELRHELFNIGKQLGTSIEDMKEGHSALIASGESWKAALEEVKAIGVASAVTGANSVSLANALGVAGAVFHFDLETPGKALELLDQMTVAGRQGTAELEKLSSIFATVGGNADRAGMSFEKTLGFIEALSIVQRQPEKLATLADSTLRLFTNNDYMETAEQGSKVAAMLMGRRKGKGDLEFPEHKALKKLVESKEFEQFKNGVRFFDEKGARRDPVAVLKGFREQYRLMRTDKERSDYLGTVFDKMDQDTLKGVNDLLRGDALDKVGQFASNIKGAPGSLVRGLPEALDNAIDQAGRLKNVLREAADEFAQPINKTMADLIKFGLDEKKLSGTELLAGGAAAVLGAYAGSRLIGGVAGALFGGTANLAMGVGVGQALHAAAGVTPVFVVNMPTGGIGGGLIDSVAGAVGAMTLPKIFSGIRTGAALLGGMALGDLPMLGSSALATAGSLALGTFAGSAGIGYGLNRWTQDTAFGNTLDRTVGAVMDPLLRLDRDMQLVRAVERPGAHADAINRALPLTAGSPQLAKQIEQAISGGNLADQFRSAIKEVGNKKATVTIRFEGGMPRVQRAESQGIDLNVDTGLLPVGR